MSALVLATSSALNSSSTVCRFVPLFSWLDGEGLVSVNPMQSKSSKLLPCVCATSSKREPSLKLAYVKSKLVLGF